MKAPVTPSGCGAFAVSVASMPVPKSPGFHPSIPVKTETVAVLGMGRAGGTWAHPREGGSLRRFLGKRGAKTKRASVGS